MTQDASVSIIRFIHDNFPLPCSLGLTKVCFHSAVLQSSSFMFSSNWCLKFANTTVGFEI